jgi:hypothetical protein
MSAMTMAEAESLLVAFTERGEEAAAGAVRLQIKRDIGMLPMVEIQSLEIRRPFSRTLPR